MKQKFLQMLASFALGMLIPCLVLQLSARVVSSSEQATIDVTMESVYHAEQPQQPTESIATTEPVPSETTVKIRVLQSNGENTLMELEDYLIGVILAEMPTSHESAALRAQAVVARTYALRRQEEQRHQGGAVCMEGSCCQAYVAPEQYLDGLGYQVDIERAAEAVLGTQGQILTYEGKPIEATYFSSSGGCTEDALAVWGVTYPYLQAVHSHGEEQMEDYRTEVFFSSQTLAETLQTNLPGTPYDWISHVTHTAGGGVDTIRIAGKTYTGLQLRKLLNLYSTAFVIEPTEDGLIFTTSGKGHRVGMSQSGAQAMALRGYTYWQILGYYYPGTTIDKIQNLQ